MKALGCLVLVGALAVGGFFAVVVLVISRGDDQSALVQRVDLTVEATGTSYRRNSGSGYDLDYVYTQGGRWYAGHDWIRDNYWRPGRPLTACVDPDDPAVHVVTIRGERCGQKIITGGSNQRAVPTTAP